MKLLLALGLVMLTLDSIGRGESNAASAKPVPDTNVNYSVVMACPSDTRDYAGPFKIEFGDLLDVQVRGMATGSNILATTRPPLRRTFQTLTDSTAVT